MYDLMAAIDERWNSTDLATRITAVRVGTHRGNPDMPYASIRPQNQSPFLKTNSSSYHASALTVEVITETPEEMLELSELINLRLTKPPLVFSGTENRLLRLTRGQTEYIEEDHLWRATVNFRSEDARDKE